MARRRGKSSLARDTAQVRRVRLARQRETPEEKSRRLYLRRILQQHYRENQTAEQKETRLANAKERAAIRRSAQKSIQRRKHLQDCIEVALKSKAREKEKQTAERYNALDLQAVEVKQEPEVESEPCVEMEGTGMVDEIIEFADEIKQEYDCEHLLVKIDPVKYEDSATDSASSPCD